MKNFINNLRYKTARFMYGRCGFDYLNKVLIYVLFAVCIVNLFLKSIIVQALYWVLFGIILFRTFSKNLDKRYAESETVRKFFEFIKLKWTNRNTYVIFKCGRCKRTIRVPRNRGKIEVTCPDCGAKKIIYTGKRK